MSRTFPQLHQQITSSSDFIKAKRDAATFKTTAINQNSKEYQDYDNNFIVSKEGNGCLISARSYKDYLSISKGKHYINPILSGASAGKYQSWMGAFLTFNQIDVSNSAPAVQELSYNDLSGTFLDSNGKNKLPFPPTTIEDDPSDRSLSSYPGYVEDPKLQFFYEKCKSTDNDLPRYITNFSELKPRERASNEYWRAVAGQSMTGFSYPNKPNLSIQLTNLDLDNAPYAPIASIDDKSDAQKQAQRFCSGTEQLIYQYNKQLFLNELIIIAPNSTSNQPENQLLNFSIPENTIDIVTFSATKETFVSSKSLSSSLLQTVIWSLSGVDGMIDNSTFFNLDNNTGKLTVKNEPNSDSTYNPGYNGFNSENYIGEQTGVDSGKYLIKVTAVDNITNLTASLTVKISITNEPSAANAPTTPLLYDAADLNKVTDIYHRNFGTTIIDNITLNDAELFLRNGYSPTIGIVSSANIDVNEYLRGPSEELIYKSWTWAGYDGASAVGRLFLSRDPLYLIPDPKPTANAERIGLVNRLGINRDLSVDANDEIFDNINGVNTTIGFEIGPYIKYDSSVPAPSTAAWSNMYGGTSGGTIKIVSGENPYYSKNILVKTTDYPLTGQYRWPETSLMLIACTWWGVNPYLPNYTSPLNVVMYNNGSSNWAYVPGYGINTSGTSRYTSTTPLSNIPLTSLDSKCIYYIRGLDLNTALNWIRHQEAFPSTYTSTDYPNLPTADAFSHGCPLAAIQDPGAAPGVPLAFSIYNKQEALDEFKNQISSAKSFLWTQANDSDSTTELWLLNEVLYTGTLTGQEPVNNPSLTVTKNNIQSGIPSGFQNNDDTFRNTWQYSSVGPNGLQSITGYKRMIAGVNPGYYKKA